MGVDDKPVHDSYGSTSILAFLNDASARNGSKIQASTIFDLTGSFSDKLALIALDLSWSNTSARERSDMVVSSHAWPFHLFKALETDSFIKDD